jgi:hypothetical protein
MKRVESYLKEKVNYINSYKESLDAIRAWIDGYEGKIVTLKGSSGSYHIIFTKQGVSFREGIYPSCEVYYEASDEVILNILQGKRNAYSEVKNNRCKVWGSLNEASHFEKIVAEGSEK